MTPPGLRAWRLVRNSADLTRYRKDQTMLTNIVDHRPKPQKWMDVWGVVEPTVNDNCIPGASPADGDEFFFQSNGPRPLADLIAWAGTFPGQTTLYIYESDPMCASGTCAEDAKMSCDC